MKVRPGDQGVGRILSLGRLPFPSYQGDPQTTTGIYSKDYITQSMKKAFCWIKRETEGLARH